MLRRSLLLLMLTGTLGGCALIQPGADRTPIQVFPDMDKQPKYKAQAESPLFADRRASRKPPEGAIAQGHLKFDENGADAFYTGKQNGQEIMVMPVKIDAALLRRGQERFNINCSPCHSRTGDGNGIVKIRQGTTLQLNPADLTQERLRVRSDGYIFNVITNGFQTMQALGQNIPEADRWAIIAYVRALQRAKSGAQ